MDVHIAVPERLVSEPVLNAGLEMNTRVNEALIREGSAPTFSQAVKNGLRWAPEPPGKESFDHALKTTARGWGDCDDLAPHQAASLRVTGQDPAARSVAYKSGPGRWHAIVQRGDGRLEDPSRTAGMKVRPGSRAAGIAPAVVGAMGSASVGGGVRPFVAVRRDDGGYLARVDVPIEGDEGHFVSVVQRGRSPSHALSGCMAGACMVGDASEMVDEDALDRMWAVHGLMKGQSLKQIAHVCGTEAAKDALATLKAIAPDLVEELRKHWKDAASLREDFDRMRKNGGGAAAAGAAVLGGRHHHKHHKHGHHKHHLGAVAALRAEVDSGPGAARMEPGEWSSHLGHERVVSPFAERFGHRGRQFVGGAVVGAATQSPYLEMISQRQGWGVPRAFGSEQAFATGPHAAASLSQVVGWGSPGAVHTDPDAAEWASRLAHERVVSPFAERFGHRGRQFVGAGLPFRPSLSFALAGEHPGQQGYRSGSSASARTPRSQAMEKEIDDLVERALRGVHPGHLAAAHPDEIANAILTALRAAPLGRGKLRQSPAVGGRVAIPAMGSGYAIVHHGNVGGAFDAALHAPAIVGWDLFKDVLAPAADAVVHVAKDVVADVKDPLGALSSIIPGHPDLGKILGPVLEPLGHLVEPFLKPLESLAGQVISAATGVISLIPGIGTGISAAISAGLALLQGGSPIDIAVKFAYGAIPIPPGIRAVTDIVVNAALSLVHTQDFGDSAIATIRKTTIAALPSFAQDLAGTVFDTLAHIVLGFVHKSPTTAVVSPAPAKGFPPRVAAISTAASFAQLGRVAQKQAMAAAPYSMVPAAAIPKPAPKPAALTPIAKHVIALRGPKPAAAAAPPPAAPSAAAALAARFAAQQAAWNAHLAAHPPPPPKPAVMPVRAVLAPAARPVAPVAPLSLSLLVRTMQPQVIRHMIAVPKGVSA